MRSGRRSENCADRPVGKQFETIDFIQNAGFGSGTDLALEMVGDNQSTSIDFERWAGFEHRTDFPPRARRVAAYIPAAEPPTTRISLFFGGAGQNCLLFPLVSD